MARRIRDHKAEYQRRKQLAEESGAKSVRGYKRLRKELSLPRTTRATSFNIRGQNKRWSDKHSRSSNSRWNDDMSSPMALQYYEAFTRYEKPAKTKKERIEQNRLKKLRIKSYLVGNGLVTEDVWDEHDNSGPPG